MGETVEFPDRDGRERTVITDGFFEREVFRSGPETARFLRALADAVEEGPRVTVSGTDWEIPFEYAEPIEVEIEFTSRRERELEIEIVFTEPDTGGGLSVE